MITNSVYCSSKFQIDQMAGTPLLIGYLACTDHLGSTVWFLPV